MIKLSSLKKISFIFISLALNQVQASDQAEDKLAGVETLLKLCETKGYDSLDLHQKAVVIDSGKQIPIYFEKQPIIKVTEAISVGKTVILSDAHTNVVRSNLVVIRTATCTELEEKLESIAPHSLRTRFYFTPEMMGILIQVNRISIKNESGLVTEETKTLISNWLMAPFNFPGGYVTRIEVDQPPMTYIHCFNQLRGNQGIEVHFGSSYLSSMIPFYDD
jgi:hypothetical protein